MIEHVLRAAERLGALNGGAAARLWEGRKPTQVTGVLCICGFFFPRPFQRRSPHSSLPGKCEGESSPRTVSRSPSPPHTQLPPRPERSRVHRRSQQLPCTECTSPSPAVLCGPRGLSSPGVRWGPGGTSARTRGGSMSPRPQPSWGGLPELGAGSRGASHRGCAGLLRGHPAGVSGR